MSALFSPLTIRGLTLRNRIVLSPMCMYSCENRDGMASSFHSAHLGARALGGCGIVMSEATAVLPNGRISLEDLGIWEDTHVEALRPVTEAIRLGGAASAIQLAHAGRKAGTYRPWSKVRGFVPESEGGITDRWGPSPIPFREGVPTPLEMSISDIQVVIDAFAQAARRSDEAGFDIVELHSAHGYLLHQFLSPISNQRTDSYGGDWAGRTRIHHEVVEAVRDVWPSHKPLFVRVSATDWIEGAWSLEDSIELAKSLMPLGVDLFDCSSGGSTMDAPIPSGPGYQVHLARGVREGSGILSGAVGQITEPAQAEEIVASGSADFVFIGREMLRDPHWPLKAALSLGTETPWPNQYAWSVG